MTQNQEPETVNKQSNLVETKSDQSIPVSYIHEDIVRRNLKQLTNKLRFVETVASIEDETRGASGATRRVEPKAVEWPRPYLLEEKLPTIEYLSVDREVLTQLKQSKELLVFIFTWNMNGALVYGNLADLIPANRYHIYAIGTQECERKTTTSVLYPSKTKWIDILTEHFGENYILFKSHTLAAINLTVFIHKGITNLVQVSDSSSVSTGPVDMGTTGGVGIAMTLGRTRLLFLCSHFSGGQDNSDQRNNEYQKVSMNMELGEKEVRVENGFYHAFWFGDLNYRVNGSREVVDKLINSNLIDVLLANDQLNVEKFKKKTMIEFLEAPITFKPTYKYEGDNYSIPDGGFVNPSWTDRILYKSRKAIRCLQYGSLDDIKISNHKPVFALFEVHLSGSNYYSILEPIIGGVKSEACAIF